MFEEKIRCFNKYLGAFFLPFRANYGFPVVVHGRSEGRTEGQKDGWKRAYARDPCLVHQKWTRWIYHFFLAMVLRSHEPSARAGAPLLNKKKDNFIKKCFFVISTVSPGLESFALENVVF